MKYVLLISLFFLLLTGTHAQLKAVVNDTAAVKNEIDSVNRLLDNAVVQKKMLVLQKHYAEDFVFTHGTGLVEGKKSWLKNVQDTSMHFLSRQHDSTAVELHGEVGIVTGTLTVQRKGKENISRYALRYVRVFAYRQKVWQLISHRTTHEWHL